VSRPNSRRTDLPLIAWGEDLRRRKAERHRLRVRAALVAATIGAVIVSAAVQPVPRLVWNASASAPLGLYAVSPGTGARRGDMVVARVPLTVRPLAAARHYIPANVPLVKHVGAVPGDTVCALGTVITIEGKVAALRRARDGSGRSMPWWKGCRLLRQGDIFLLATNVPASFDGRYFGVSPATDIVGIARPIWVR
jgi:conjugative transfer signal peptidase TraF